MRAIDGDGNDDQQEESMPVKGVRGEEALESSMEDVD
jgi:hypothetical protein